MTLDQWAAELPAFKGGSRNVFGHSYHLMLPSVALIVAHCNGCFDPQNVCFREMFN